MGVTSILADAVGLPLPEVKFIFNCAYNLFKQGLKHSDEAKLSAAFYLVWDATQSSLVPIVTDEQQSLLLAAKELVHRQEETGVYFGQAIVSLTLMATNEVESRDLKLSGDMGGVRVSN